MSELDPKENPSFVVLHVDDRGSVSVPEPVNAFQAVRIASQVNPRRGRCAKCVNHVFVDRTDGEWKVQSFMVRRPHGDG